MGNQVKSTFFEILKNQSVFSTENDLLLNQDLRWTFTQIFYWILQVSYACNFQKNM